MNELLIAILALLTGSLPIGVLLTRLYGIDVRKVGSGNVGATNVARAAGKKLGLLTLVGDTLKGVAAVSLSQLSNTDSFLTSAAFLGFLAITGHCFSPFLRFRGGKGVATGLGVFLALSPLATLGAVAVFAISFMATRYVSLSSVLSCVALPFLLVMITSGSEPELLFFASLSCALIIFRHKDNIRRLLAGKEEKFSGEPADAPVGADSTVLTEPVRD